MLFRPLVEENVSAYVVHFFLPLLASLWKWRWSIVQGMSHAFMVVGLGELLWDFLPTGKQLGGAPANVAYHAQALGDRGLVLSRIGADALGEEALSLLRRQGIDVSHVQQDRASPTGTVSVSLNQQGHPTFVITHDVAWDNMVCTDDWRSIAADADAVCFGTLAQRSSVSSRAVRDFLDATSDRCLVTFDVNLRQFFYSAEIIRSSLERSNVCKLNEQELPTVASIIGLKVTTAAETARRIVETFDLRCMAVTRGEQGSVLVSSDEIVEHPGYRVEVQDTVGAGDAFTAGLIHGLLRDMSLRDVSQIASERGAWVAASQGAMPDVATFHPKHYA